MNLIPSGSGRLCCNKTQSNLNARKRLEGSEGFAAPGVVLAIILAVIINNPVAVQSPQTTPARLRIRKGNHNADNADQP
jgi:hypothetical protein